MTARTTFIYGLVDPRNGVIRYVGKANNPEGRLAAHCACRRSITRKERWIESLRKIGAKPSIVILDECLSTEWPEVERRWIAALRDEGVDLTNLTAGGEGTEDMDAEACARKSASIIASWADPEVRSRKIESLQKAHQRPEVKVRHSVAAKANWRNPSCAAQMRSNLKEAWKDQDLRERVAEAQRAAWADPERRAKRCEAIKKGMAASGAGAKISATKRAKRARQQEEAG